MHNPLNIPLAKNIWACKRRSAGVKATPIQQAPPIMPNEVAKKFNKDGLNAVLMKKKRMIKVNPHKERLKLNKIKDILLFSPE